MAAIWRFRIASGCSVQVARRSRMDGLMFRIFSPSTIFGVGQREGRMFKLRLSGDLPGPAVAPTSETRTEWASIYGDKGFLHLAHASHSGQNGT